MLDARLEEALNKQIANELYAAHLYLSMAAYFESRNLRGFANWMKVQHQEETAHAMKVFDFVADRGGRVRMGAISEPPGDFASVLAAVEGALEHERQVTRTIYGLYELAQRAKDYASLVLLEWFVSEQVEEEKTLDELVEHLKLIGNDGTGLIVVDERLGRRTAGAAEAAPQT